MGGQAFPAQMRILSEDPPRFAVLSGDVNPLHVDPLYARRTQFGRQVAHGVDVLLRALEHFFGARPGHVPAAIRVQFVKPAFVGDTLELALADAEDAATKLVVTAAGSVITTIAMSFHGAHENAPEFDAGVLYTTSPTPCELDLADVEGRKGRLPIGPDLASVRKTFPRTSAALGATAAAALVATSRLVGMECPGLHSIFSGLSIRMREANTDEAGAGLAWRVRRVDRRLRKIDLDVRGGGISGRLETFLRVPPTRQSSMNEVSSRVDPRAFAGHCALVIGGSRGLGEVTAKIIAAGGGTPIITYALGRSEALRVAAEIEAAGGTCSTLHYEVRSPSSPQLAELHTVPTSFYYFATPGIFRRKSALFEPDLMREFLSYFVDGFHALCSGLAARHPGPLAAFYPSTAALDEPVRDLAEYSMAKRAGEELCAHLTRFAPELRIVVRRLPRIRTDQTATLLPVPAQSALDAMLPIVREVEAAAVASAS
jgi:acyl dehydratase